MQPGDTLETWLCFLLSPGSSQGNTSEVVSVVLTVPRMASEHAWEDGEPLQGRQHHSMGGDPALNKRRKEENGSWIKGERERTAAPISCSLTAEEDWWTQAPANKASPTGLAACSNCGLKYVPPSSSCFCLGYFPTAEERQRVQLLLRSWSQAKG